MLIWTNPLPISFVFGGVSLISGMFNLLYFRIHKGQTFCKQFGIQPVHYALAFMGGGLYTILFYAAFKIGPVDDASVITYLWPTLIIIFTPFILHERLKLYHLAGLSLALAGIGVLSFVFKDEDLRFELGFGPLLALCAAIIWALYTVLSKKYALPDHAVGVVRFSFGCVTIAWCLVLQNIYVAPFESYCALITLGLCSAITFVAWNMAYRYGDSASLGVLSYLTPVLGTIWFVLSGEVILTGSLLIATVLVMSGAVVANYPTVMKVLKGI